MNFLFAVKVTSVILQCSNICNFKKIMLICFVFSVALAWNGEPFIPCKGNNSNKNISEAYNLRITSETDKLPIQIVY